MQPSDPIQPTSYPFTWPCPSRAVSNSLDWSFVHLFCDKTLPVTDHWWFWVMRAGPYSELSPIMRNRAYIWPCFVICLFIAFVAFAKSALYHPVVHLSSWQPPNPTTFISHQGQIVKNLFGFEYFTLATFYLLLIKPPNPTTFISHQGQIVKTLNLWLFDFDYLLSGFDKTTFISRRGQIV